MVACDAIDPAPRLLRPARIDSLTPRAEVQAGTWNRQGGKMFDPLLAVGLAAVALTTLSLVVARIIPDRYDHLELSRVHARRR